MESNNIKKFEISLQVKTRRLIYGKKKLLKFPVTLLLLNALVLELLIYSVAQ